MTNDQRVLTRPSIDAGLDAGRKRVDSRSELLCLEFELDHLDFEIAAEQLVRWRQLAPQLKARGFDLSNQPEPKLPRPIEQPTERRMAAYERELTLRDGYLRPSFWLWWWKLYDRRQCAEPAASGTSCRNRAGIGFVRCIGRRGRWIRRITASTGPGIVA